MSTIDTVLAVVTSVVGWAIAVGLFAYRWPQQP
jgi:hypothetical protein